MPQQQESTQKIRVLCVTPTGLEGQGGIDRLYLYLRQQVAADPMIDIRYFAARGGQAGWKSTFGFPLRLLQFIFILLTQRIDIVHLNHSTHGSAYRKWLLASIAKMMRRKVSAHFHGMVAEEDYAANPLWLKALRSLFQQADRIVVLGSFYIGYFRDRLGVDPAKLVIIANGIPDFAPYQPVPKQNSGALNLLFAGEVGARKGAGLLLEALAILKQQAGAWHCTIAGNGDIPEYRTMSQMLGLKERVSFTGWVSSDTVHDLMRQADIVLLPSRIEALPLSLIEGACAGCALIASNAGASAEVVQEGVNGRIIPLEPVAIAETLAMVMTDTAGLARMQSASRHLYRQRFEMPVFANALNQHFHMMMQTCPSEPMLKTA